MFAILRRPATIVAGLTVMLATLGVGTVGPAHAAKPYCGIKWGSQSKTGGVASEHPLGAVRTGRHKCFDRVVFDLHGTANGYEVAYVSTLHADGEGRRLPVSGGAVLRVQLRTSVFDQLGHLHYARMAGDHVANLRGYRTLRDVVYAGCFEGTTTFGVGVRNRLPFRMLTLAGPGSHSRIVLDVAHKW